jgi:hypothetical protein
LEVERVETEEILWSRSSSDGSVVSSGVKFPSARGVFQRGLFYRQLYWKLYQVGLPVGTPIFPEFEQIFVGGNPIQNQAIATIERRFGFFFSFDVETPYESM